MFCHVEFFRHKVFPALRVLNTLPGAVVGAQHFVDVIFWNEPVCTRQFHQFVEPSMRWCSGVLGIVKSPTHSFQTRKGNAEIVPRTLDASIVDVGENETWCVPYAFAPHRDVKAGGLRDVVHLGFEASDEYAEDVLFRRQSFVGKFIVSREGVESLPAERTGKKEDGKDCKELLGHGGGLEWLLILIDYSYLNYLTEMQSTHAISRSNKLQINFCQGEISNR